MLDEELSFRGGHGHAADAGLAVDHPDRKLLSSEPLAEAVGITRDLDPRDAKRPNSVTGPLSAGMQTRRNVPGQEERQPRRTALVIDRGRMPANDPTVGPGSRTSLDLEPEPSGDRVELVRRQRECEPAPACRRPLEDALAEPGPRGLCLIDRRDELQILLPQRHDPIRRPPSLVPAAGDRVELERLQEPDRGSSRSATAYTT